MFTARDVQVIVQAARRDARAEAIEECAKVAEECRVLVDDELSAVDLARDVGLHLAIQIRELNRPNAAHDGEPK